MNHARVSAEHAGTMLSHARATRCKELVTELTKQQELCNRLMTIVACDIQSEEHQARWVDPDANVPTR
ncbi:hypothetical protein AWB91_09010 [Mycobacterium paraense]|uniref:Transposase n=1 Tax=Mycobacterium paraense TaxID=767916 RepID=A0ABX3VTC5_9MYCO|nr:hypothetical protein AWB91_09010 [Mycobacterium paraense]ORW34684.1 hypothetical protein AWB88_02770 [Mycobacterium paraense]